jgi:hypothetical protein
MMEKIDPAESQRRADEAFREASERSMRGVSWTPSPPPPPPATEWERLLAQADALDRQARGYIGCTWVGDRHPSSGLREQAAALRRAAAVLKREAESNGTLKSVGEQDK